MRTIFGMGWNHRPAMKKLNIISVFFPVPRCLANHGIATQTDDGQGVMEKLWLV